MIAYFRFQAFSPPQDDLEYSRFSPGARFFRGLQALWLRYGLLPWRLPAMCIILLNGARILPSP